MSCGEDECIDLVDALQDTIDDQADEIDRLKKEVAELRGAMEWQPIETAPRETELLVGRWVNNDWRICQSGFYFDRGSEPEGEPAYWYWRCDWDSGDVTDNEGPTHWLPIPKPPAVEGES